MEWYKKYRPKSFSKIVGQDDAIECLTKFTQENNLPHALLLCGPSGVGKTTIARILKSHLNCTDNDFREINCADFRGIDTVREIRQHMNLAPVGGKSRIWLIDEAHQMSNDAQTAFLKMLEDTPRHVYFILATTHKDKLIVTVRGRCTQVHLKPIAANHMKSLLTKIATREKVSVEEELIEVIIDKCEGSARESINLLQQCCQIADPEKRIEHVRSLELKQNAFNLVRAMLWEKSSWSKIVTIINELGTDQDWEGLRYLILANATNELLKNNKNAKKAFAILDSFKDSWIYSKRAGLVHACFDVIGQT